MAFRISKKTVWICCLLLLAAAGGGYYFMQKADGEKKKATEIHIVTRGTIEDVVTAQGTLEPKEYVDVGAQVSGQIKKLYVDIGDTVKTGDLLAEIDPKTYETIMQGDKAQLEALQAQLVQQQAQTDYDRLQFERAQKLAKVKAISQEDVEEKEKALKVAEATLQSLQAQIVAAQAALDKDIINLGYTKIYATMDGIVSDRTAREGQTLNANQTTPTILQIANLKNMTVSAEIAEADIMRLSQGMQATFTTLGSQERRWTGAIRQILPTPEIVNDVVLYKALVDVENVDGQLMNGMSTQVSFVVAHAENVLVVPTRALGMHLVDHDSDKGKVYRVRVTSNQNKESDREVLIGLMTRASAEVLEGLKEGDRVLTNSESGLEQKGKGKNFGPPGMGARL